MGDLKLFRIDGDRAHELEGSESPLEKSLQLMLEQNLEALFGVRLLASEYVTSKRHAGRMDSLGIDENGSPVIFEYKRASNENVINQGLFYLDWLLDHRAEFQLLVQQRLGDAAAKAIDWTNPRLVCVAADFNRYDEHAVAQIDRSIELVRYRHYEDRKLLALELVTATTPRSTTVSPLGDAGRTQTGAATAAKTVADYLAQSPQEVKDLFDALEQFVLSLGDDVTKKATQGYYAYRRLKNFVCVEVYPQNRALLVFLKVDPDSVTLERGFTRDVRKIGHAGTGDLELRLSSLAQMPLLEPLIRTSYEAS